MPKRQFAMILILLLLLTGCTSTNQNPAPEATEMTTDTIPAYTLPEATETVSKNTLPSETDTVSEEIPKPSKPAYSSEKPDAKDVTYHLAGIFHCMNEKYDMDFVSYAENENGIYMIYAQYIYILTIIHLLRIYGPYGWTAMTTTMSTKDLLASVSLPT